MLHEFIVGIPWYWLAIIILSGQATNAVAFYTWINDGYIPWLRRMPSRRRRIAIALIALPAPWLWLGIIFMLGVLDAVAILLGPMVRAFLALKGFWL